MTRESRGAGGRVDGKATVAVVSPSRELIERLASLFEEEVGGAEVALVVDSYEQLDEDQVEKMIQLDPSMVVLDLDQELDAGLSFASFLQDSLYTGLVAGVASAPSQELLINAMRAGVSEVISTPITPEAVLDAVERARRQRRPVGSPEVPSAGENGETHVFVAARSGVGATTLAINYGVMLHSLSKEPTLLVDLDVDLGEVAASLGMTPEYSTLDLLENLYRADSNLLAGYVAHHPSGVDLLAAPDEPGRSDEVSPEDLGEMLRLLKRRYRYLVADVPGRSGERVMTAATEADRVFLVATPDVPALRNVVRIRPALEEQAGVDPSRIHVVVNRHRSRSAIELPDIEKAIGTRVFATVENDYATVSEALNLGRPAIQASKSHFTRDIRSLVRKVRPDDDSSGRRQGLRQTFSRFVPGER